MNISKEQYLQNPCRTASIPYWKAKSISIPDHMKIVHEEEFRIEMLEEYQDEPYFRLMHDLRNIESVLVPKGYSVCAASLSDFAAHINECYENVCMSESDLQNYITRAVYCPDLWLAVKDNGTGKIVATGIAELDCVIGEGALEWIQVSKDSRKRGLGSYIVLELLWRMRDAVKFVTVSGRCHNPANPESLYRRCGFSGNDVWHVLRRK